MNWQHGKWWHHGGTRTQLTCGPFSAITRARRFQSNIYTLRIKTAHVVIPTSSFLILGALLLEISSLPGLRCLRRFNAAQAEGLLERRLAPKKEEAF